MSLPNKITSPPATIHQMGYSRKKKHAKGGGPKCTGSSNNNNGNRRQRGRGATSSAIHVSVVNNAATPDLPIRPLEINQETRWKPRSLASNIKEAESSETHDSRLLYCCFETN